MSQPAAAITARCEPSPTLISSTKPWSIAITDWTTRPAVNSSAAPTVRLVSPAVSADILSARSRGSASLAATSNPSADTNTACATPGTSLVNAETNQPNDGSVAVVPSVISQSLPLPFPP